MTMNNKVTKHLAKYYTRTFEQNYIYSYLKEVNREVLILDYSKESDLQKMNYTSTLSF